MPAIVNGSVRDVLVGFCLLAVASVGGILWSQQADLSTMQGNRFTAADGLALEVRMNKEVEQRVAALWERIDKRLVRLENKLDKALEP